MKEDTTFTAFSGSRLILSGPLRDVVQRTKQHLDNGAAELVLIFDDSSGRQLDFDFQGTEAEVLARLEAHPTWGAGGAGEAQSAGPGRPKLGVVCREVSLLPRHWEWLEAQPQGISVTLRRLVEEARKREPDKERQRRARDAAGKFMWVMAGNLPDFEEASRALYADDLQRLQQLIAAWPRDLQDYILRLLKAAPAGEAN